MSAADRDSPTPNWPPGRRALAAAAWGGFLAACLGSLLLFAALDPQQVIDGWPDPPRWLPGGVLTASGIYTLGFFLLWVVGTCGATVTAVLLGTPER